MFYFSQNRADIDKTPCPTIMKMLTENIDIYMEIREYLNQLGFEGKKADVYLASLELGSSTIIEISRKAGIKRTTCYDIVTDLKNAGLISETAKGKKRLFVAENPEKLKKDWQNKEKLIDEILPQLVSIYNVKGIKPKIRFYEGKEGLKEVYSDTLKYFTEILSFASEDVVKVLGADWADNYIKQRVKKEIHVRAIIPRTEIIQRGFASKDREQLRMTKLIDPQKYPFSIEINIYGHQKVALMSPKEQTGVIIEGAEIYKTMKLIFELLWDNLPEIK
jgi:sugar-specific transcriptional regulator TrmB